MRDTCMYICTYTRIHTNVCPHTHTQTHSEHHPKPSCYRFLVMLGLGTKFVDHVTSDH